MTRFFIAPYQPTPNEEDWQRLKKETDLAIDPQAYRQGLVDQWPQVRFFQTAPSIPLEWEISVEDPNGTGIHGTIGMLHSDLQVISVDTPWEEFFVWHRSFVPHRYQLFLFYDSSWESLELTQGTTLDEVRGFVGGGGER